jgi:hypothetical protein
MKRAIAIAALVLLVAVQSAAARARSADPRGQQSSACLIVLPSKPVVPAPGQPAIGSDAAATPVGGIKTAEPTSGLINALCDITLNVVGCSFPARDATITCDTSGTGVPDLVITAAKVTPVSANLVQAVFSTSASGVSGSAFPLACCGGFVTLTLSVTVSAGDDNIFGPFTETATCSIDLGQRAPVIVSASPATGDCSSPQNLILPGFCFILPNGSLNVTSVFAVELGNPSNVIQSSRVAVVNANFIDALFNFGSGSAGKTFLIFASGPNGTSRNLTSLPDGAPSGCPLGNEQGVQVTFGCTPVHPLPPPPAGPVVTGCELVRNAAGSFFLNVTGSNIQDGARITVGGVPAKKVKFKGLDAVSNTFTSIQLKGGVCAALPGDIVIANPDGIASAPFQCTQICQ